MTNDVKMESASVAKKAPKRKKIASLDRRKARSGWFFILPFLIGFVLIYLPMLIESLKLSFYTIDPTKTDAVGLPLTWVGWDNYREALLGSTTFAEKLVTGLQNLAFEIPAILIFSLFMAVMLNQKAAGRGVFRAIFFIPVVLSTGIMESIAAQDIMGEYMEGTEDATGTGESTANQLVSSMDLQSLFANMKVGTGLVDYVATAINNIYGIVNRSGVQMLIFLAGLQSISPAIYESCKIDGATAWETFWKITFPMISPMILVNGVYTIIDSFTTDSNVVMQYVSNTYSQDRALSSAMSWVYFLIVAAIVGVLASVLSAFVFYGRKND
ncbi:MAG: sugar ABC transporter permease [Clostridia bacterium]|nr:sugar ABC transporter permease [Clostridia bacterium]